MKIMTGIDLHSNNALCGMMDEDGRRVLHRKLPCDLSAILQVLEPYKNRIAQVAVESTYNWYWLVDGLEDHGYPVVLANPARMKQYDGLKHTDDVSDAFFLCELMRLGILPTCHRYDRQSRPVRDLLRRRMLLVQLRTSLILSFKSLHERTLGQPPLLQCLSLTINEEIRSRVTYSALLPRLAPETVEAFILDQLDRAGLGHNTYTAEALALIVRSGEGLLRRTRNLCVSSLIEAVRDQTRIVDLKQVNRVLIQPHWRKDCDQPLA